MIDTGGSTADAAWFTRAEAALMALTEIAAATLARTSRSRAGF